MDQHLLKRFVEIMKSRLFGLQNEIWFERKHIVKEPSELVDLATNIDLGSCVVFTELVVSLKLLPKLSQCLLVEVDCATLLQDLKELIRLVEVLLVLDACKDLFF